MIQANGLAHQQSRVARWLERESSIWEAMGSIPLRDSDFSWSHTCDKWSFHLYHTLRFAPTFAHVRDASNT